MPAMHEEYGLDQDQGQTGKIGEKRPVRSSPFESLVCRNYCRLRWGMIRHFFGKKVSKPFEKRFKIV